MTIDFDNASAPEKPVRWEMKIMAVSVVLGILAVVQSFGLMYLGKTVFGLDLAQLQTMMFLQLVAGRHLMLFVTRSETEFWRPPYPPLVGSCQCCPGVIAVVLASNLIWMVVLDWAKLAVYRELRLRDEGRTPFLMRLKTPLYPGTSTGL